MMRLVIRVAFKVLLHTHRAARRFESSLGNAVMAIHESMNNDTSTAAGRQRIYGRSGVTMTTVELADWIRHGLLPDHIKAIGLPTGIRLADFNGAGPSQSPPDAGTARFRSFRREGVGK